MGGWVYVMSREEYSKWYASGGAKAVAVGGLNTPNGGLSMAQAGAALFQQYQCASCHSGDAVKRGKGPSLVGIYGTNRQMANGKTVKADDGYLRNVLYYPNEYTLKGWPQGMPSYRNLTEEQVLQINAYVKSLSGVTTPNLSAQVPGPAGAKINQNNAGSALVPGAVDTDGGSPDVNAPAADTDNQQWRYMYGGEQYK